MDPQEDFKTCFTFLYCFDKYSTQWFHIIPFDYIPRIKAVNKFTFKCVSVELHSEITPLHFVRQLCAAVQIPCDPNASLAEAKSGSVLQLEHFRIRWISLNIGLSWLDISWVGKYFRLSGHLLQHDLVAKLHSLDSGFALLRLFSLTRRDPLCPSDIYRQDAENREVDGQGTEVLRGLWCDNMPTTKGVLNVRRAGVQLVSIN